MYRFNPKVKDALAAVKAGKLGKIYSVEAQMSCKHTIPVREWLENFKGGMMFFLGCHLVDLIYQIQGEPEEIIPLNCSTGIGDIHTDDYGMVVFKYPNGVSYAKTCDNECGGFMRRQLVICGEKGTIEIKPLEVGVAGGQYTVSNECFDDSGKHWSVPWESSQSEVYDRYDTMIRNFAEVVRGKENPYPYDYELDLYKLVLRACGKEI
jgi:predicted dehydrogenase